MNPMVVAALVGGGLDFLGNMATDIFNVNQGNKELDYMKWAQEQTWNREDTAVQRRMKDLEKAGFNPLLAVGQSASTSSPVRVDYPRSNMKMNAMETVANAVALQDKSIDMKNKILEGEILDYKKQIAEIEKNDALGTYATNSRIRMMGLPERNYEADVKNKEQDIWRKGRENEWMEKEGLLNPNGATAEMMQLNRVFERMKKDGLSLQEILSIASRVFGMR